jgi:hypothetical protein
LLNADSSDDAALLLAALLPTAEEPDVPRFVTDGSEKPALVPLALLPRYAILLLVYLLLYLLIPLMSLSIYAGCPVPWDLCDARVRR